MQAKMAGVRNRPIATKRSSGRTEEPVLPLRLYARGESIPFLTALRCVTKANGRQRPIAASARSGFRNGKRMHPGIPLLECPYPVRFMRDSVHQIGK